MGLDHTVTRLAAGLALALCLASPAHATDDLLGPAAERSGDEALV